MSTDADWRYVPRDPDEATDLGYDLLDLDVVPTSIEGKAQVIILPENEELLRDDAFIIVDEATIRDLDTMV